MKTKNLKIIISTTNHEYFNKQSLKPWRNDIYQLDTLKHPSEQIENLSDWYLQHWQLSNRWSLTIKHMNTIIIKTNKRIPWPIIKGIKDKIRLNIHVKIIDYEERSILTLRNFQTKRQTCNEIYY